MFTVVIQSLAMTGETHLFFGKSRTNAHDVYHVALYHAHIHEVTAAKGIEFLALAFSLFLLLSEALMAGECETGWFVRPAQGRKPQKVVGLTLLVG